MEEAKKYILANILPPLCTLSVCLLGAFFIYHAYYKGPYQAMKFAKMEPAAGHSVIYDNKGNSYLIIDTENIKIWSGKE